MQNRFTAKDFFYMLIGLLACFLLFLNMHKTNREVVAIEKVNETLRNQQATLGSLKNAIEGMGTAQIDPEAIRRLASAGALQGRNGSAGGDGEINIATYPEYQPGFDIQFSGASVSVNRTGRPQAWQAAPDSDLPDDFAPGGTVVSIWNEEPQTLTPFVSRDRYATDVHRDVLEKLIWIDLKAPFQYVPGLARSWEISDDGMEITFHIFENATWPNGTPVTADDVIFTFDLVMNPEIDAPQERSYLDDNIEYYERLDTHTVRFRMKQKYFDALGVCGNLLSIIPRYVYGNYGPEEYNTKIRDVCIGSGPWMVEEWDKGRQLVLRRNENYWGPKPPIETHVIRFIDSEQAGLQEFWAGKADFVWPTSEQWVEYAESDRLRERGIAIDFYTPLGGYSYIGYNLRLPKFADKRTRQALTMLVNRQEMIDTLRGGLGRIVSGPFYYKADQYNNEIEPWPYDPERAKRLLREVGWEDRNTDGVLDMDLDGDGLREPFVILFTMPTSNMTERYQRFIQDAFKVAGIRVNLDIQEWSVFEEKLTERDFEMVMLGWTGSKESDPNQIWHSSESENRGSNYIGFVNKEADDLIERGRTTIDYDERMKIWHQLHALLHEEQPYTFLFVRPRLYFADRRIQNVIVHDFRLYPPEWYITAPDQGG